MEKTNHDAAKLVDTIIIDAYNNRASDIHIEPSASQQTTRINFSIDGVCREYMKMTDTMASQLLSCIKSMAGLDASETSLPQGGIVNFSCKHIPEFALRVTTFATGNCREGVVLKIITSENLRKEKASMSYESHICGNLEIDKEKWEEFCKKYTEAEEIWRGHSINVIFNTVREDEWEWEGDVLSICTTWCRHYDFEKFLDAVVELLNEDQTGYFDWHGEDYARSVFYLKKDYWEEVEWQKPPTPEWWLEMKAKKKTE